MNRKRPTNSDDFFPYSSDFHAFWTGCYGSRPAVKYYDRSLNGYIQAAKQSQVFGHLNDAQTNGELDILREAIGILQHHDAIAGTEKQAVANDYIHDYMYVY